MKKYDYLIFDLDNTLFDFSKSEYHALQKVFATHGVIFNEDTFAQYQAINGELWRQLEEGKIKKPTVLSQRFSRFFSTFGLTVDGKQVDEHFRGILEERNDLIPGALEILDYVSGEGYTIFAGTNGVVQTQIARLENGGMTDYFDRLYISEEVGFEKPDVRFFDYIFNDTGIRDMSKVLMIGDSLSSDIEGANRVGIDSIWLSDGTIDKRIKSTYRVNNLSEIAKIL